VFRPRTAILALLAVAGTIATINLQRYFVVYPAGLPWGNTEVARPVVRFLETLTPETHAYVVDPGWGARGIPEFKSVRYGAGAGRRLDEIAGTELDCARLARLERPGVLVWRPSLALPSPQLCACAGGLASDLHLSPGGLPLFRSAPLPPIGAAPTACPVAIPVDDGTFAVAAAPAVAPSPAAATAAGVAPPPPDPPPPEVISPSQESSVRTAAGTMRVRHPPLDMGAVADAFDGDAATLMRGARDNPFRLEIDYPRPVAIAAVELRLGYLAHYEVTIDVADSANRRHVATRRFDGVPGVAPTPRIPLPAPVGKATSLSVSIRDLRPPPPEGTHVHVYEVALR
jgi:hypothetical protein